MFHVLLHHVGRGQSAVAASLDRPTTAWLSPQRGHCIFRLRCSTRAMLCRRTPTAPTEPWGTPTAWSVPRDATRSHLATYFARGTEAAANDRHNSAGSSGEPELHRWPRSSRPAGYVVVRGPLRLGGWNNDQCRIVTRRLARRAPNLLQKSNTLLCIVGLNTGQTFLVSFVHLLECRPVSLRVSFREKMSQKLFDVGTTQ